MSPGKVATLGGGIAGHALAILCWYVIFTSFQVDALKWWVNLILPLGAVLLGMIGGVGFRIGGRMTRQAATPGLAMAAAFIAVIAAVTIRFCGYWTLQVDGQPVHELIGFVTYLRETLGHARIDFSRGGHGFGAVDIGAFGYFMELFQTAAYALTSYAFVVKLPKAVWCNVCERHMDDRVSGDILRNDPEQLQVLLHGLPAGGGERFAALSEAPSDTDGPNTGAIKLTWRVAECPTCNGAALAESGEAFNGQHFMPVSALHRLTTFDRSRAAAPPPPAPIPAQPVGFGRRVVR